jgi:hypothetical protein
MKKIMILTAITSTLSFSEVYYKNKEEKYNNRMNVYTNIKNDYERTENVTINGEVQSISDNGNKLTIIVRNYTKEYIRIETRNTNINVKDKVSGTCTTYEASTWKNCSIYTEKRKKYTPSEFKDIEGKIKYISILNEYKVLEVYNYSETLYLRVNKNINYKRNEQIYGKCKDIVRGEYTNCNLRKRY